MRLRSFAFDGDCGGHTVCSQGSTIDVPEHVSGTGLTAVRSRDGGSVLPQEKALPLAVLVTSSDPLEFRTLLRRASESGYEAIQIDPRFPTDRDDVGEIVAEIEHIGLRTIAVGGNANPLQPDADVSISALRIAIERASLFGCDTVVTWSGTRSSMLFEDHSANELPETWQVVVERFRMVAGCAESAGITIAIEPFHNHIAGTPERLRDLVDAVASPQVGCVMDPPNFLKAWQIEEVNAKLPSMFETLSGRITLVHAKDLRHPYPGEKPHVLADVALPHPGKGIMDYALYGQLIQQYYQGPIVVEHITEEKMEEARAYVAEKMGVLDV